MTRHIAFLRGINVGGKNTIPMKDLKKLFESSGFINVQTFIQSGNVIFDSEKKINPADIENRLAERLGDPISVILRSYKAVEKLLTINLFEDYLEYHKVKCYITFLSGKPQTIPQLPLIHQKEGLELIGFSGLDVFLLSREINGRYGFPNNFIEKEFGIPATTRNWSTIRKMIHSFNPKQIIEE